MTAPISYGGKPITSLSDQQLRLAQDDVAKCLLRAYASPALTPVQLSDSGEAVTDKGRYAVYFQSMSDLAVALQAEKQRRGL